MSHSTISTKLITAKCVLCSDTRFMVELDAFSPLAIDIFKTCSTTNYDRKTRQWSFSLMEYSILKSRLGKLRGHLDIVPLPKFVLKLTETNPDYPIINIYTISPGLTNCLMPFQRDAVLFGIRNGGRCLIADDIGLGKIFQSLAIASYYRKDWPLLIITTASMKTRWEEIVFKFISSVSSTNDILIVSHDMIHTTFQKKFGVIIIDESHKFKNLKAKDTQAAMILSKQAKRVILLSGTPALSRPEELFAQLSMIDDTFFESFFEYSKRYCDGKYSRFGWDSSGQSNLKELEIILSKKFMLRRTKDEVLGSGLCTDECSNTKHITAYFECPIEEKAIIYSVREQKNPKKLS